MKPGPQQQVLGRIAGDRELREDDEVGGVRLGLGEALEDQLPVPVEIADDRVDLGQCEPHGLSLAVSDSQSKTETSRGLAAAAELHHPEGDAAATEHVAALERDAEVSPAACEQVRAMRRRVEPQLRASAAGEPSSPWPQARFSPNERAGR